jgi:hypothetical protein
MTALETATLETSPLLAVVGFIRTEQLDHSLASRIIIASFYWSNKLQPRVIILTNHFHLQSILRSN